MHFAKKKLSLDVYLIIFDCYGMTLSAWSLKTLLSLMVKDFKNK